MSTVPAGDLLAQLQLSEAARQKAEQGLEKATERISELQAELQSFAYAAGHDLREPLRTIGAYSQLLQNLCKDAPESADFIRFIKEAIAGANHLIERLLTFSRAGTSTVRSPMDLGALVQMAMYSLSGPIGKTGTIVQYENLHQANVNDSDLKIVFESLIDNAIKYRGADAPLLEIKTEEGPDALLVAVRDHGPGIEPAFQKQVFMPFKRLHGKDIPGAGLGLAICRKVIVAHGGEIWVREAEGGGAEFCFTLPY